MSKTVKTPAVRALKIPGAFIFALVLLVMAPFVVTMSELGPINRAAVPLAVVAVVTIGIKLSTTEMMGGRTNLQRTYFDICLALTTAVVSLLITQLYANDRIVFPAAVVLAKIFFAELSMSPAGGSAAMGIWAAVSIVINLLSFLLAVAITRLDKTFETLPESPKRNRVGTVLGLYRFLTIGAGSCSLAVYFSVIMLRTQ
jgi:hypothetical protein